MSLDRRSCHGEVFPFLCSLMLQYTILVFNKLFFIKLVHSFVFWFQVGCLVYILYAGVTRSFGIPLLLAVGSILLNGLLLLLNQDRCPFTTLAERLGARKGPVTDMFLPDCLADNVFKVSTVVFTAELVLLAVRFITGL